MHWMHNIAAWWIDFFAAATVLLIVVLLAGWLIRQPVQRMALAWSAMLALAVLAVCCAMPAWPRVALIARLEVERKPEPLAVPLPVTPPVHFGKQPPPTYRPLPDFVRNSPRPPIDSPTAVASERPKVSPAAVPASLAPADTTEPIDYLSLLVVAKLLGSLTILCWLGLGHWRARRLYRRAMPAPEFALQELRSLAGRQSRLPKLLVDRLLTTAAAMGLWRPAIVLPAQAIEAAKYNPLTSQEHRFSPSEKPTLRALLAHEYAHIKNRDLWLLALGRLLLIWLFAHPLYWLLRRRIRIDQELLADAAAAEQCGRHEYAETLLAWARTQPAYGSRLNWGLGIWERPSQLSRRISMLLNERMRLEMVCSRKLRLILVTCAVGAVTALSFFTLHPTRVVKAEALQASLPSSETREEPSLPEKVIFEGNTIVADARLRHVVQGDLENATVLLTAYYRKLGYFDVRVGHLLEKQPNWITLKFIIQEGSRYSIRNVTFAGNQKLTSEDLSKDLTLEAGESFNQHSLDRDIDTIRDLYGSQGYIFADVQADPKLEGDNPEVNLVYKIKEGKQYRIGKLYGVRGTDKHELPLAQRRHGLNPGDIIDIRKIRALERQWKFTFSKTVVDDVADIIATQDPHAGPLAITTPYSPDFEKEQEDTFWIHERYKRVPILGPITTGGNAAALNPPSDEEVLQALEESRSPKGTLPLLKEKDHSKVRIVKEKIADYVDGVQSYPLIGKAQLHHAHYKCTVYIPKGTRVGDTKLDEDIQEIVYVDHNHFHVVADSTASEAKPDLQKVTISGTVRDEKRKPVANAHVRLFRHDNKPGTVSRPIGRIKVVQAAGVPGAENQGQVLLAVGGAPAAGALGGENKDQLIFGTSLGSSESQQLLHETWTDTDGHFQFPDLPADEQWETQQEYLNVIVQAPGKGTAFQNAFLTKGSDGKRTAQPLKVDLQAATTLRGRVTDAKGRAVMGAVVFCGAGHNMPKPVPGIVCTVTDADGRFEINDLSPFDVDELPAYAPGAFATMQSLSMAASVEHPNYAIGAIEFTRLPAEVNCVLQRPASVHGQVLLDGSDRPAKNAVLTVNTMGSNVTSPMATAATDDEGKFTIANLSPGKYTIEAKVPDRLAAVQQVELKSGDQSLEFRLKQGGVIKGRLVDDATGKGPDFTRTGTGSIAVNAVGGDPNRMCQSWIDKDGTFLVAVHPGRNMVMYPHPEWEIVDAERWIKPGVEVAQGQTVEIEMRVKPRDGDWETVFSDAQRVAAATQGESLPPPKPRQQRGPDREWRRWFDTLQNWPDDALPKKPMAEETLLQKIDESEGVSVGKESIDGRDQITVISLTWDSSNPGELQQVIWLQQGVLSHIAKFPHLKAMELTGGPMPDDWFKPLRDHQHLESLDIIFGKNLTSAGMEHLATLPNLKKFSVVGYKLDDKALQAIGRFRRLEELAFAGVITDAGVASFQEEQQSRANIKSLSIGALRDSKMTDESLKYLAKLTSLEELSLYNSEEIGIISPGMFTDEGLKHLAPLTKLHSLFVGGEKITDAGLVHLHSLKNLKSLKLDGTSVTNKGIDELKKHLPELKVTKSFFGEEEAQAPSPETEAPKFKAESAKDESTPKWSNLEKQEQSEPNAITFSGNASFSDKELYPIVQGNREGAVRRLIALYRNNGFFLAKIGIEEDLLGNGNGSIKFVIHEGYRYAVRTVSFAGNEKLSQDDLGKDLKLKPGEYFNQDSIDRDINTIRDLYGSQGYIFADVQADPKLEGDKPELDLVYKIKEGKQYRIGKLLCVRGDDSFEAPLAQRRYGLNQGDIIDIRKIRKLERYWKFAFSRTEVDDIADIIATQDPQVDPRKAQAKAEFKPTKVTISGICLDEKRKPVADVHVRFFRIDGGGHYSRPSSRMTLVKSSNVGPQADQQSQLTYSDYSDSPDTQRLLGEARTDAKGKFEFEQTTDERWYEQKDTLWVIVQAPGKATQSDRAILTSNNKNEQRVNELKFRLPKAASLNGRITNTEGNPVAGAVVLPCESNSFAKPIPGILCAVTDADGRFDINDLAPFDVEDYPPQPTEFGAFKISSVVATVEHPDYAQGLIEYSKTPATANLVLQPPARLAGQVEIDGDYDKNIPTFVKWTHSDGLHGATHVESNGTFHFERLAPGKYTLETRRTDRLVNSQEITLATGNNQLTVKLKSGGFIKGRVIDDATGKAPKFDRSRSINVVAFNSSLPKDANGMYQSCQGWVHEDGSFSLSAHPGNNHVLLFDPDWQFVDADRWLKKGIELEAGKPIEVELRVKPRRGGWQAFQAEMAAFAAEHNGEHAPKPAPSATKVEPDAQDHRGDDMAKAMFDWPDDLMPKKPMSEEALMTALSQDDDDVNVEYKEIGGSQEVTSIRIASFEPTFDPELIGHYIWLEYSVLAHIDRFPHIEFLMLTGGSADDQWLKPLRDNQSLKILALSWPKQVSAAGVKHLSTLPNLNTLGLTSLKFDADAIRNINDFPKLETLQIGGSVGDETLAHLRGNKKLKNVIVMTYFKSNLTDESLLTLATLPNLERLAIQVEGMESQFTDKGLEHLAASTKLHNLFIGGKQITDAGLVHLRGLKALTELDLKDTSVTQQGVDELKKHLPLLKATLMQSTR